MLTFPWLWSEKVYVIILLTHGPNLAAVLTHTPHQPPHWSRVNVKELGKIRPLLLIQDGLGEVVWTDSGPCRCYHSDAWRLIGACSVGTHIGNPCGDFKHAAISHTWVYLGSPTNASTDVHYRKIPNISLYICWSLTDFYRWNFTFHVIIKSEVWPFSHCLWLGHETMACDRCLFSLRLRHNGRDGVSNHDCLLNRLFRRRSKKTSKLRVTGHCAGDSPGTGEFPAQIASNAENVSIWWRQREFILYKRACVYIEFGYVWKDVRCCTFPPSDLVSS